MADPILLARAAAAILTDERTRKAAGWTIVAILSPLIVLIAFLCALGSGAATHNVSAAELCFHGGTIPADTPEEYQVYIEDMRSSFTLLDSFIATINNQIEEDGSLDEIRVKAIFYALYFGEDSPSRRAHRQFTDCFVTYEERTRTVTTEDEDGNEVETEETYTVAVPITDIATVYQNIQTALCMAATDEQRANADSIDSLIRYGWAGAGSTGGGWSGELGEPAMSVDGFCSPLGAGWRSMITSNFGYRTCPYHGRELHSGLDMGAPSGTPIRAALAGTVTKSYYSNSYGNYTIIDHGNGLTTAYAHQSKRLVAVGDTVEAGEVIGLVGSTGNSTGPHLHFEVRVNDNLQDPKNYLP